jgi:hypothetical protein
MPLRQGLSLWLFLQGSRSRRRVMTLSDDARFGGVYGAFVGSQSGYVCPHVGRAP